MPGHHNNHVHFARATTSYSPPHMPPFLKFTPPTTTYSPRILSPSCPNRSLPQLSPSPMPYPPLHLPDEPHHPRHTIAHRYLSDSHGISWDMRDHPSNIRHNHCTVSDLALDESATNPPSPFMLVTCIYLPWAIKVPPSNRIFVKLKDVLESIYHSLRTNISTSEFALITASNDQYRASRAYEERYRRLHGTGAYEHEKTSGMRRIDFLMGHTHFKGLNRSSRNPEEWHLMVE